MVQKRTLLALDNINEVDAQSWNVLVKLSLKAANVGIIITGKIACQVAKLALKKIRASDRLVNIVMNPLNCDDVGELAQSLTRACPWPHPILKIIHEVTAGDPLQCLNIIKTLIKTSKIEVKCVSSPEQAGRGEGEEYELVVADDEEISNTILHFQLSSDLGSVYAHDQLTDAQQQGESERGAKRRAEKARLRDIYV